MVARHTLTLCSGSQHGTIPKHPVNGCTICSCKPGANFGTLFQTFFAHDSNHRMERTMLQSQCQHAARTRLLASLRARLKMPLWAFLVTPNGIERGRRTPRCNELLKQLYSIHSRSKAVSRATAQNSAQVACGTENPLPTAHSRKVTPGPSCSSRRSQPKIWTLARQAKNRRWSSPTVKAMFHKLRR